MFTIVTILILIVLLWAAILQLDRLYDLESRGIEVSPGVIMWRTRRGIGLLDRINDASRNLWKVFGALSGILGSVFMVIIFLNLADKAVGIVSSLISPTPAGGGGTAGVMPLIPGWTFPLEMIVPFLIAIATVILVHEPAHGIISRRVGLPVESTGLLLFAVIPGAFVEPDEEKLQNASVYDRLQVYGAGSFANILLGLLSFGVILALITPLSGLYVSGVFEDMPAEGHIQPGNRILEVGRLGGSGMEIEDYQSFSNFMENTRPGDSIWLTTEEGYFELTLTNRPPPGENIVYMTEEENVEITVENQNGDDEGFIGIGGLYYSVSRPEILSDTIVSLFTFWKTPSVSGGSISPHSYDYHVPELVIEILQMMAMLNLGVGLFNLLPLKPLDGGHMAEGLVEKISSKEMAKDVAVVLGIVSLSFVLINLMVWVM